MKVKSHILPVSDFKRAAILLKGVINDTPLVKNEMLSDDNQCEVFLKREDLQNVRSYKIRGAYTKMKSISSQDAERGIVCASAGNHAQGVALACQLLGIHGIIYMPSTTPAQKIRKVKRFGKHYIEIRLIGDTFDDAFDAAMHFSRNEHKVFIHPFDDDKIISGQGTVGVEILEQITEPIDYLFLAIGGGGLAAGIGSYFSHVSPETKIIGVEPAGAPAMYLSLKQGKIVALDQIDPFVDGAAVKKVGALNFTICQEVLHDMLIVNEGKVCSTMLQMYNEEAIVLEPAGALAISALNQYRSKIKGKKVVCIVSGGNNDITRTEEIRERSLLYEGLKHYFIIRFPQRAGALQEFLSVLGPNDDIAFFEYTKKTSRTTGPAIVGIELRNREDYPALIERMEKKNIQYQTVNDKPDLLAMLV